MYKLQPVYAGIFKRKTLFRLWRDILESLSGTEMDFTKGHLGRAVLLLSVPMVLEMIWESVFAITDIFFVAKLGSDAIATVGLTESMLTIVYSIGIGFSLATTAVVARRIGEKDKDAAAIAAVQSIIIGILLSAILCIPGILFGGELLRLMGASEEVVKKGAVYPTIMISGNATIILLFIINAIFRSSGDAAVSMKVLLLANLINIILDPCLILGLGPFPELGIKGAAIATNIGRGIAVGYQVYLLFRGNKRIMIKKRHLQANWRIIKNLIKLSGGGMGQYLIATASWIGLVRIVAEFGSEVLAGYTIAIRILMFSLLPSFGLSNAAATLVGQNLGASNPSRAARSVWVTSISVMVFLGLVGVMLILFSPKFVGFFISGADDGVLHHGVGCLRTISFGMVFYGLGMVMVQAFNGAGDTNTPTLINFICFWLVEIPLAYFLSLGLDFNEKGVYFAILVSESLAAFIGVMLFLRGRWKLRVV